MGEYVTKEARNAKAQQIKSSHFQLAYGNSSLDRKTAANGIEEEANR